jgi:cytochrome c551/c552
MKSLIEWLCALKSASLSGALLFYNGASVGDALLSTVACVNCHVYTQGAS